MSKQVQTIRMIEQYGNLKVGLIPLDFANAVIIAANVVQNTTEGGRPDGNTAPILQRINSATDKALRLTWAAGSQVELQFPAVALPPDLDDERPDGNTAPILQRINSATDKALRLTWAAGSQVELQFPAVALPPDLDD